MCENTKFTECYARHYLEEYTMLSIGQANALPRYSWINSEGRLCEVGYDKKDGTIYVLVTGVETSKLPLLTIEKKRPEAENTI